MTLRYRVAVLLLAVAPTSLSAGEPSIAELERLGKLMPKHEIDWKPITEDERTSLLAQKL